MIEFKLDLKSSKPSTIYDAKGKAYKLQPGLNVLNMKYDDYVNLAKALSITPKPDPDKECNISTCNEKHCANECTNESVLAQESPSIDECTDDKDNDDKCTECTECIECQTCIDEPTCENECIQEQVHEDNNHDLDEESTCTAEVDYSTWTYTQLKNEYKNVTGKTCKLKKDEIIAFLQER